MRFILASICVTVALIAVQVQADDEISESAEAERGASNDKRTVPISVKHGREFTKNAPHVIELARFNPRRNPMHPAITGYDAFVCVQSTRIGRALVPTAVLVGTIQSNGSVSTRTISTDKLNHADRLLGVRNGQLFVQLPQKGLVLNLRTGKAHELAESAPTFTVVVPNHDATRLGTKRAFWDRGNLCVYDLMTMTQTTAWSDVRYTEPRTNVAMPTPPLAWLNDHHLLTVHTASEPQGPGLPDRDATRVVVVDIQTKEIQELGIVPWGFNDIVPPHGPKGDAAVIVNGRGLGDRNGKSIAQVYAVAVPSAIDGHAQLEKRAVQAGAFTLGGAIWPTENGAIQVEMLSCGENDLATDAIVSVSPDGKRVLWCVRPKDPNIDGVTLYYFDSAENRVQEEIATADHLQVPIWATQSEMAAVKSP